MLSHAELQSQVQLGDKVKPRFNNGGMASELWQRMRALRKHTKLSGEAFGAKLGASKGAVSQWESASPEKRSAPDLAKIVSMSEQFKVPLDWLLKDSSDADFEWWATAAASAPPARPDLSTALEVIGERLQSMAPSARASAAAVLELWARDGAKADLLPVLETRLTNQTADQAAA